MKQIQKKSVTKTVQKNYSSLGVLLEDLFSIETDSNTGKSKNKIRLSDHRNALKNLSLSKKLSSATINTVTKLVAATDPELKLLLSLLIESANCVHVTVRKELVDFAAACISEITFLNPKGESNVLQSLKDLAEDKDEINYCRYLLNELSNKCDKHEKQFQPGNLNSTGKASTKELNKKLNKLQSRKSNLLSITLIWCFHYKIGNFDEVLNRFNSISLELAGTSDKNSHSTPSIGIDNEATRKLVYFIAGKIQPSKDDEFVTAISYFRNMQKCAESHQRQSDEVVKKIQIKLQDKDAQLEASQQLQIKQKEEIEQLKDQINQLKSESFETEQVVKAQHVHLKDDTSNIKAKASNFFEEEVLPELQVSLSLLDREKPKAHIAIHKLDLIIEKIEEEILWFKG